MNYLDLNFSVFGAALLADHGYALYAALARLVPALHEPSSPIRIGPVRGSYAGDGLLQLDPRGSRLMLRLPADMIPVVLPLAGELIDVAGHRLRLGVPSVRALVPAPTLLARTVVIKASSPRQPAANHPRGRDPLQTKRYLAPEAFLAGARKQLIALGIGSEAALGIPTNTAGPRTGQPRRRLLRIHDKKIIGFPLLVQGLTAEESIRLQEEGVGGRGKMGCGFFVGVRG